MTIKTGPEKAPFFCPSASQRIPAQTLSALAFCISSAYADGTLLSACPDSACFYAPCLSA